jgi:F0F1-type ATP synthase delta subunit
MRKAKRYAKLLRETQADPKRFVGLLKRRGDLRLLSEIQKEFQRDKDGRVAEVISVKEVPQALTESLERKGYLVKRRHDKSVLGGAAVILSNEYLIDNTVRGQLQKLWQKISYTTY